MAATRGHFAGNAAGAREYLADLAAAGEWKPAKPLGEYSNDVATRKASSFYAQQQAGAETLSNADARGHGRTGEHGITTTQVGQSIIITFRDAKYAPKALKMAEKYGERAAVNMQDKRDGHWTQAFTRAKGGKGYSLDAMRDAIEDSSISDFMHDAIDSPELDDLLANIGEWQIEVF